MTKEEKLAMFKAYLDGKPIECREKTNSELEDFDWRPVSMPSWSFESYDYRIKSEEIPADTPTIDWKASFHAMEANNKKLQSAYDEMKGERDALEGKAHVLQLTIDEQQLTNESLVKSCDALQANLASALARIEALRADFALALDQRDKAEQEADSLRGALNTLHDTLHNAILS